MRYLAALALILVLVAGGVFIYAGRLPGPTIEIAGPAKYMGQSTPVEVAVSSPGARVSTLRIVFEQNGKQTPIFSLDSPASASVKQETPERVRVTRMVGRDVVPELKTGAAKIIVTATHPVVRGLRTVQSTAARDVQVRLERPTIAVLSTKHYVNLGGSEMVVYRVSPRDVQSGVQVGDLSYPGYPAASINRLRQGFGESAGQPPLKLRRPAEALRAKAGASAKAGLDGIRITDPAVRVAFFALRFDQDVNTPMYAYARDEAGNSARADFDHLTFPKPFKRSRIELNDQFLNRVVPAILETTSDIRPDGDTLQKFLAINGELRHKNAEEIANYAKQSAPDILWGGVVFHPFTSTAVEAAFADQRTYVYRGKEVDRQVHLGFDLAKVVNSPVLAANRGKVLHASPLGIYGNCVILDHGMGVQSLYAHLSSIGVQVGQTVEKEQELGRSGMTGLAGGDHLHFTMLVNGQMVTPVEWWDAHWIEDRILRKLREAGGVGGGGVSETGKTEGTEGTAQPHNGGTKKRR